MKRCLPRQGAAVRCRHRGLGMDLFVQYQANGEVHDATDANSKPIAWRCVKCGDYAILGQATDTGPHAAYIAVEMRAAELVQRWNASTNGDAKFVFSDIDDEERRGWSMAETNMREHTDAWHAGCLARVIVTHTEGE